MPWIGCGPLTPPESTGDAAGSTATKRTDGLRSRITSATPVIVPPVPTAATKMSSFPSVSRQTSSAVVEMLERCLQEREQQTPLAADVLEVGDQLLLNAVVRTRVDLVYRRHQQIDEAVGGCQGTTGPSGIDPVMGARTG